MKQKIFRIALLLLMVINIGNTYADNETTGVPKVEIIGNNIPQPGYWYKGTYNLNVFYVDGKEESTGNIKITCYESYVVIEADGRPRTTLYSTAEKPDYFMDVATAKLQATFKGAKLIVLQLFLNKQKNRS